MKRLKSFLLSIAITAVIMFALYVFAKDKLIADDIQAKINDFVSHETRCDRMEQANIKKKDCDYVWHDDSKGSQTEQGNYPNVFVFKDRVGDHYE